MKIFLTGSSSCLAHALLPRLCAHPEIHQITGIDLKPPHFRHKKFSGVQLDIRSPQITQRMQGCDALVHLAFVVLRGKMSAAEMVSINLGGSQAVFESARAAGISRMIHVSSAAVYGSGENLDESAPLQPLPGFLYARHKAELEHWLEAYFPATIRLRPHIILGPNAQPLLRQLIRQPCYIRLPDPQPLLQCVHENDVCDAIAASLFTNASGAFNLAARDTFSFKQIIKEHHAISLGLPLRLAQAGLNTAWKLTGAGGEPAWLDGMKKTLTLDCTRAKCELGWQAASNATDAIAMMARPIK